MCEREENKKICVNMIFALFLLKNNQLNKKYNKIWRK